MKKISIVSKIPQESLVEQLLQNMNSEEEVFKFIKAMEAGFESFELLEM